MTNAEPPSSRLDRLEAILSDTAELVLAHDEALNRIENAIEQLTTRVAENNQRIEQILEYLFRERPNGRGGEPNV
ncbi:hypothetical protein SD81_028510 [Tolypothrix campylonemoides VB511288]|nr:hypothetical protein SD81_028510 [Tolypothrix campylonemoides VB511288]